MFYHDTNKQSAVKQTSAKHKWQIALVLTGVIATLQLGGCRADTHNAKNQSNNNAQNTATASADSSGADTACDKQLLNQVEPMVSEKLAKNSYPLCFNGFRVRYSGVSKTPIWVAEYLTRERLGYAKAMIRDDNFHEETQLPASARSRLEDYKNSGYDRGHLAPNADMPNKASQSDSFSFANIAPQFPENNRKTWVKVESKTRDLTNRYGKSYVVTGTTFLSSKLKKINNNVIVPTHFFKAVYFPQVTDKNTSSKTAQAVVFISPNNASDKVEQISLAELQQRTGIDAFPEVSDTVKNNVMRVNLN